MTPSDNDNDSVIANKEKETMFSIMIFTTTMIITYYILLMHVLMNLSIVYLY